MIAYYLVVTVQTMELYTNQTVHIVEVGILSKLVMVIASHILCDTMFFHSNQFSNLWNCTEQCVQVNLQTLLHRSGIVVSNSFKQLP